MTESGSAQDKKVGILKLREKAQTALVPTL
jgi:hypothetical protein